MDNDFMASFSVAMGLFLALMIVRITLRYDREMLFSGIVWAAIGVCVLYAYMTYFPIGFLFDPNGGGMAFGLVPLTVGHVFAAALIFSAFQGGSERQTSVKVYGDGHIRLVAILFIMFFVLAAAVETVREKTDMQMTKVAGLLLLMSAFGSLPKHINGLFGFGLEKKK